MKIIDQTPFDDNKTGEISILDREKAIIKFGTGWIKEVEAQKSVIAVLDKALDDKFTLLRNVTPPDLDIKIPFILVGPTGVFVMCINSCPGLFVASGDQWGLISEGTLRPEKPNLLIRTEWLAHAIQVFLQQPGLSKLTNVEPVLLCPDPFTSVDDIKPIIRVVMHDALEPFAASISQSPLVLNPESVLDIVDRIQNPTVSTQSNLVETATDSPSIAAVAAEQEKDLYIPAAAQTGLDSTPASMVEPASPDWLPQPAETPADTPVDNPNDIPVETLAETHVETPASSVWVDQPASPLAASPQTTPPVHRRSGKTGKLWVFLIIMFVILCIIVAVLAVLIAKDYLPQFITVK